MSVTFDSVPATSPANPRSRVILASLIGTTIEFYDFYVYATAAVLVFPHLFFPAGNETTALLASFAVFGAAMIARPLARSSSVISAIDAAARSRWSVRC